MAKQFNHPAEAIVSIESDYHQWALETAEAIQKREFDHVDWEHIVEELRSLAKSEEREIASRLAQLMFHLLKKQYQPERSSRSWDLSIADQRDQVVTLIAEQPSLKRIVANPEFWSKAYQRALGLSAQENLPESVVIQFPETCPFGMEILSNA